MKRILASGIALLLFFGSGACSATTPQDTATSFLVALFTDPDQASRHRAIKKLCADEVDLGAVYAESDGIARLFSEANAKVSLVEAEFTGENTSLHFTAEFKISGPGQDPCTAQVFGSIKLGQAGNGWRIKDYDMDVTELLFLGFV